MNNQKICIFGGTTEGRILAKFLSNCKIEADLFIATSYGWQFVEDIAHVNVYQQRLNENEMIQLFKEKKYDFIVDATHPFAKEVSKNLIKSSKSCNIKYLRVIRESVKYESCKYFNDISQCIDYLNSHKGIIFLTTGSKDLDKFTKVKNYSDRIHLRILPMESSLKRSIELGYSNRNIICMQGPFTEELNTAIINSIGAKYMVTKESTGSGGLKEKADACVKTRTECLVLKKVDEDGLTLEQMCAYIAEKYQLNKCEGKYEKN
jgi:precorrin-6x reductase